VSETAKKTVAKAVERRSKQVVAEAKTKEAVA
jgi:hypothetical protein